MALKQWQKMLVATAAGLSVAGLFSAAKADSSPRHKINHPKPAPVGEKVPFLSEGSATSPTAPTLGVIGDSVARDYAYYLARELGPSGVRVVDVATSGCPASALPVVFTWRGQDLILHCPDLVRNKENAMVKDFHPKVVLWHSIQDRFDIIREKVRTTAGTAEWARQVMAEWDDTLTRVSSGGAQVLIILPLWFENQPTIPLTEPGYNNNNIEKLRDLYRQWAPHHRDRVTLVDVAPLVCPSGPPCGPVGGIDFRPDGQHFDDPGGKRVAAYLLAHAPALTNLVPPR